MSGCTRTVKLHAHHVRTAEDVPVLHHPALRQGNAEELPTGVRITTPSGDRLDLDYAVWVLRQHAA